MLPSPQIKIVICRTLSSFDSACMEIVLYFLEYKLHETLFSLILNCCPLLTSKKKSDDIFEAKFKICEEKKIEFRANASNQLTREFFAKYKKVAS